MLKVKIFADGADKVGMLEMNAKPYIKGLTTNPTLMSKAGITDYRAFCQDVLAEITEKPLSFEVFSDDFSEMERQALEIASWGDNVYVKIPVTNTRQETCYSLVTKLAAQKVKLNVTAMMTLEQVRDVTAALDSAVRAMFRCLRVVLPIQDAILSFDGCCRRDSESLHQRLNLFGQVRGNYSTFSRPMQFGCQVITVTNDILKKLSLVGYDLDEYSLDTVKMFYTDAVKAGFKL